MDLFFTYLDIDWSFIDRIGDNPFEAMLFFFLHGGWIAFIFLALFIVEHLWLDWRETIYSKKRQFMVLSISVPRMHEQGPRAVDNMFAYLAGAHATSSWKDKWIDGKTQDTISCEIVSLNGQVQFVMRAVRGMRDLIEAAIFSQYPDAEITEIDDYVLQVPQKYPDDEWDLWGTEMIPVKDDSFPMKTYFAFEDQVSGEFKDPLSALLEGFSRLGQGENAWFQIVLTPIGQVDFAKKSLALVKKLKGEKVEAKKTFLDDLADLPITIMKMFFEGIGLSGGKPAEKKADGVPAVQKMSQGEKDVLTGVEYKMAKLVYLCKLRFLYVAKKQVMNKARAVNPFIGAIKQFNTNNMQALKPETKRVGVNGALWWFKERRNGRRKTLLMHAYHKRSNHTGTPNFHLNTEELASFWHFPHSLQVKAPQLKKTEAKLTEPPANLPFAD